MNARRGLGHRAQRTGFYAESRMTNWRRFSPGTEELHRVMARFGREIVDATDLLIRAVPVRSSSFLMPVTCEDVAATLDRVPKRFLQGLHAVFLLGGSAKQEQVARRAFAFGRYFLGFIVLHAYPLPMLKETWRHLPKPSVRREYDRVGATWRQVEGGWQLEFTPEALHKFYLHEVLLHEVAHHADRWSGRPRRDEESFANWMAQEFASGRLAEAS